MLSRKLSHLELFSRPDANGKARDLATVGETGHVWRRYTTGARLTTWYAYA
jgi:hypothetical protein